MTVASRKIGHTRWVVPEEDQSLFVGPAPNQLTSTLASNRDLLWQDEAHQGYDFQGYRFSELLETCRADLLQKAIQYTCAYRDVSGWVHMETSDPCHFSSGPGAAEEYFGPMPREPGHQDMLGGMGIYVCEAVWAVVRPLTFLIWGGIFERYPKLKVVVTEATTTWVANYLEHLDDRYLDWHVTAKLGDYKSHLSMKPSDYFHRNIRLGTFFRRKEVERRHEVGHECMMWGSDYPHPEGTWPYTRDMMVDAFRGVPEAEIATMLGGSAAAFYNLDTDKLAPLVAQIGPDTSLFKT